MKKQDNIPYHLFAKFFSGEISEKEQKELDNFISKDPAHEKLFNDYEHIWSLDSSNDKFSDKTESALKKVKKELNTKDISIGRNRFKMIYRIAAAVIIIFGLSYFTLNLFSEKEPAYTELKTEDSIIKKELSDGSIIWLNKNSKLEYPEVFGKDKRIVKLSGEAYFIVSHDPYRPFIAETEFTKTEVLGTEFNLKANSTDKNIELVLVKGKVKFTDDKSKDSETLVKNEKVTLDKDNRLIDKTIVKSENFLTWKTNEINLDNLSIGQIAEDLSKYFEKEIIVDDDVKDSIFHQTLPFTNPNLNDILNNLKFSLNLSVDSVDEKIIIKKKKF